MESESNQVVNGASFEATNVEDAPESEQEQQTAGMDPGGWGNASPHPHQPDGLLDEDRTEMSERVAYLEKRVREHQDEIVCLKGALSDVTRRLGILEVAKSQNSILPSKPMPKSPRRAPSGQERPKSYIEATPRVGSAQSHRPTPRGPSATSIDKKWGSMSNSLEETNGHRGTKSAGLNHAKKSVDYLPKMPRQRSTSHGSLAIKQTKTRGIKEPTWNEEEKYLRMHLKGRPVILYAPSNVENLDVKAPQDPPKEELKLEWVYGYRGRDCRSNLYMLPTGEVIYFSAGVVVLHNIEEQTQRHYTGHTDDIKCIAIHPDQVKVASGQVSGHDKKEGKAHVRLWDSVTLNTLCVFGEGDFSRGVCCVSFSKLDGGKHLLAVDESDQHKLSIWDVSKESKVTKVAESKASNDPVTQCEFHPYEEDQIVCCGKGQISFWNLQNKKLDKKLGIFGKNEKPKVVICFAFTENGNVVSGDNDGNIFIWERNGNKVTESISNAHVGGVFSLCAVKDGKILSGGKDRKIIQWDSSFKKTGLEAEIDEKYGSVRMISQGSGNMLLVGTIRNCILQGNLDLQFRPVVESHMDELWGLDTSPSRHQFITCGYDGHIYMWDGQTHSCIWSKEIASDNNKDSAEAEQAETKRRRKDGAHSVCIHPTQEIAVVGMQNNKWIVVDLNTHETVGVYNDGKEQQECVQFSPDGSLLAVGNRDNHIYLYEVSEDGRKYKKIGRCTGHSSYVTHIDWATNNEIFRSNSGDYEVLYWHKNCKQETDKDAVRNLEWATNNCTLSFNSIGIWPDNADGTDINNCSVSHNRKLIASADDYGKVNLLEYPSIQPRATGHSYEGHSSHVTMAKFLFDDSRVLTTGGRDSTVLQWQVV